jgi:hypothetical protein
MSAICGYLLQQFGRRSILIDIDLIGIVASILSTLSIFSLFVFARTLMGIVTGINKIVIPIYFKEISPIYFQRK